MILNNIQYENTKTALKDFQGALDSTILKDYVDDRMKKIHIAGIRNMIRKLEGQIEKYESLISGSVKFKQQYSIEELYSILPQVRIASGMTQEKAAKLLDIELQKFRQLEDSEYYEADSSTIIDVANLFDISVIIYKSKIFDTNLYILNIICKQNKYFQKDTNPMVKLNWKDEFSSSSSYKIADQSFELWKENEFGYDNHDKQIAETDIFPEILIGSEMLNDEQQSHMRD